MKKICICALLLFFIPPVWAENLSIYSEESAPYQMFYRDGTLGGMAVEVVREIQKRVGNTDVIQLLPWNRAYTLILKNKNTVLFSMVKTDERKDLFQWVGPIADLSLAFYKKKGSPIRVASHEDAKKVRTIGVYANDISEQYLKKTGYRNLVSSYDNHITLKNLMNGRVDLISIGRTAHRSYVEQAGFKADDVQEVFVYMQSSLYIVFSKSTPPETAAGWNAALASMKKDGSFARIYHAYFPGAVLP